MLARNLFDRERKCARQMLESQLAPRYPYEECRLKMYDFLYGNQPLPTDIEQAILASRRTPRRAVTSPRIPI